MENLTMSLNLSKLTGSAVVNLKGRSGQTKKCLVLPIEDSALYVGEKGIYLSLVAFASDKLEGASHFVKQSLSEDVRKTMTDDQLRALPILGNVRILKHVAEVTENMEQSDDEELPF